MLPYLLGTGFVARSAVSRLHADLRDSRPWPSALTFGSRGRRRRSSRRDRVVGFLCGRSPCWPRGPRSDLTSGSIAVLYEHVAVLHAPPRAGALRRAGDARAPAARAGSASPTHCERARPSSRRTLVLVAIVFDRPRATRRSARWRCPPRRNRPRPIGGWRSFPSAVVAEFPFFVSRAESTPAYRYMLMSTLHWKPLLNGYSDHIRRMTSATTCRSSRVPSACDAWEVLQEHRVALLDGPLASVPGRRDRQVLLQVEQAWRDSSG